jgi:hypothetical protein
MMRSRQQLPFLHVTQPVASADVPKTIPERLDALPWNRWHLRFVIALGVTWLLDGLEGSPGARWPAR